MGARFLHYMNEFPRYMRYVFTGHLAIVLASQLEQVAMRTGMVEGSTKLPSSP